MGVSVRERRRPFSMKFDPALLPGLATHYFIGGWGTACGASVPRDRTTYCADPDLVTCLRCRRTAVFREENEKRRLSWPDPDSKKPSPS